MSVLPLELGQVSDPTARRAFEQISLRWPMVPDLALYSLKPGLVSALPVSPVDGQEVYFQNAAMAAQGCVWHLRYRAASASIYKWEFVGGAEMAAPAGLDSTNSVPYIDLPSSPQVLTAPLAGTYNFRFGGQTYNSVATTNFMGIFVASVLALEAAVSIPAPNIQVAIYSEAAIPVAALSDVRAMYHVNAGVGTFMARSLMMRAVRVG